MVLKHSAAPEVGERAIPSKNPVLKPGVDPKTVTTAEPPDRELLRTTVAAAMAANQPFVVTFATPLYCQTRTCGPVVQVDAVRREGLAEARASTSSTSRSTRTTTRPRARTSWVDQWELQSEPFTFVVDKNGVIRSRLEGAFSAAELEQAVSKIAS